MRIEYITKEEAKECILDGIGRVEYSSSDWPKANWTHCNNVLKTLLEDTSLKWRVYYKEA